MAYSFFAKPPPPLPTTASTPKGSNMSNNIGKADLKQGFKNGFISAQPANTLLPPPLKTAPSPASSKADPALQHVTPYPHIPPSFSTPHPQVTIEQVKTAHVPSLMRITGLLLPVRYPNSFYTATITDPLIASLSRVAIYHDNAATSVAGMAFSTAATTKSSSHTSTDKVIGGIRCRLEPIIPSLSSTSSSPRNIRPITNLYIQTLHLLSPYRGRGVAASLLNSLLYEDTQSSTKTPRWKGGEKPLPKVSAMVRHYNIRTVTAHVHETNDEALSWYISRGFAVQDGVVEGYYRRLTPGGAKIVRLELDWSTNSLGYDTECNLSSKPAPTPSIQSPEDDDWEKVELSDCQSPERLDDYQNIERNSLDEEGSVSKRLRTE